MSSSSIAADSGRPDADDKQGDPPGPRLFEALPRLLALRHDRINPIVWAHEHYGSLVMFKVAFRRLYLLNEPDAIHELLVTRHRDVIKDTGHQLFLRPVLRNGLLLSEGQTHLKQRRMMQPAFHMERLAAYAEVMAENASSTAAAWHHSQPIDAIREMMELALGIVAKTLFNTDVKEDSRQVAAAIEDIMEMDSWMLHPLGFILMRLPVQKVRRFRRALNTLDRIVYRIINEHREAGRAEDLVDMLLGARDEVDGTMMSDEQIRNEVLTLFLAGHETTANTMTWAWRMLADNPEAEAKFHEEVDRVLDGRIPTLADVPQLEYTGRVIAETLRLYPPAYLFGREPVKPIRIAGYRIPKGSQVLVSPYVTHRDPRFFDEPERFDPDRFTDAGSEGRPKFAYYPFGAGPRKCIGERFAQMEAVLVLAAIGRHWRLRATDEHVPDIDPRITLRPRGGMPMVVERRQ